MNILGMGPLEILLIVVLALIVFGPAKLPEIMGQVGRAIAEFRRTTSQLSDEFNRTIAAELQETRALVDDTKSAVSGVHTSINSAITGTPAPVRTAVPGETLTAAAGVATAEATANGSNGTNGVATPHSDAPLASAAPWNWETSTPAADPAPVSPPSPPAPARKPSARNDLQPPY
jgi:TatA/E family protein of Tat protein translocase